MALMATVGKNEMLNKLVNQVLTLKLFSNNVTPALGDTAATFTEISGGGYVSKTLAFASWVVASGIATYNAAQDFNFTGATAAPGTAYGYFIINASGTLIAAERFAAGVLPFSPVNGSLIRVTPKITVS